MPEKKQVALEFLSGQKRFCKRYSFFPFLYVPNEKEIVGFLLSLPQTKISFSVTQTGFIEVIASDFDTLLNVVNSLQEKGFGQFEVIEPQTQFLLQKDWSFYDLFSIEKEEIIKANSFVQSIESQPLKSAFSLGFFQLKNDSEKDASLFLEKICLANLLAIHPSKIVDFKFTSLSLTKNWFFKNGFPLTKLNFNDEEKPDKNNLVEFDFSDSITNLFCEKNLGLKTINCDCCVPSDFFEKNVLSNSQVLVEFLVNGFYFEPKNKFFAKDFHEKNSGKLGRLDYQSEWNLNNLPVGPFSKGQKVALPLLESKFLNDSQAKIVGVNRLFWHCTKNKSFISKELSNLISLKNSLQKNIVLVREKNIVSSGILFSHQLSTNFSFYFFSSFLKIIEGALQSFPSLFSQGFSSDFRQCFDYSKSEVLSSFVEFSQKNGFFGSIASKEKVFLNCDRPLLLAEAFSSQTGFSRPKISFKQD